MAEVTAEPLYPPRIEPPEAPLSFLQFLATFVRNPLLSLPRAAYEQSIVVRRAPTGAQVAWVTGPDLVEQILVEEADAFDKSRVEKRVFARSLRDSVLTADGAAWRWQRRAIAPLFRHSEILGYVPAMAELAVAHAARWPRDGGVVEIDGDMQIVTFQVIARALLADGVPQECDAILAAMNAFLARSSWEAAWAIARLPRWLPHPASLQMSRASHRLRTLVSRIVARRHAAGRGDAGERPHHDLLDRLLAARDPDTGEPMSIDQLVDNALTLLAAGHETTAHSLAFTLYLLARSPYWQEAVRAEVVAVAGDGPIEPDHVARLTRTRQVLQEAMRLYPAAPVMARCPNRAVTVGGHAFTPADQIVIPIWCIHRHRALWTDPDRFDPDRFADGQQYPRTQYMPFGAGQRICVGQSLAMTEAVVLLATFVRGASFAWAGTHEPTPLSRITLRPQGGMPLRVTPRA